jgi:hypothetical protein
MRLALSLLSAASALLLAARTADAGFAPQVPKTEKAAKSKKGGKCVQALTRAGVEFERVSRPGINVAVRISGELGGIRYRQYRNKPLIIDCSLAYSLLRAGDIMRELGIERATFSAAYQRRKVRGTNRISGHSYGLAVDVHVFTGENGELSVLNDYQKELGDEDDCVGKPRSRKARLLRQLYCRLTAAELFRFVLTPDYNEDHANHFHLEAFPWSKRRDR